MAALHLATLSNEEKLKVVEAHADSGRFDMVWRFMFGLASKHHGSRSDKVISLDDGLMDQCLVAEECYHVFWLYVMLLSKLQTLASQQKFVKVWKNLLDVFSALPLTV